MTRVADAMREAYKAFDEGTTEGFLALLDPDVEWDASAALAHRGVFHGHEGVLEYLASLNEVWENFSLIPAQFTEVGSRVIVTGRIEGTLRDSQEEVTAGFVHRAELRRGKIVKVEVILDWDEAAAAVKPEGRRFRRAKR